MHKKETIILIAVFLLACSLRLIFVFNSQFFSDTDSYYYLRLAENIRDNGLPNFYDELSYGGRTAVYSPVFYYIFYALAPLKNIEIAAKIFSSIMISTLIFPVYLISRRLTKKKYIALLTSLISVFIPAYISLTFNTFSPNCLIIPLIFFTIYFIMDIKKYTTLFIIANILGAAIHPSFIFLIMGFLLYILLTKIAGFKTDKEKLEAILFSTLLTCWVVFLIYKNAFLMHGLGVIWRNVPQQILRHYFSGLNVLESIYEIGLVPLLAGIFISYKYISSKTDKNIYLIISFGLAAIILSALHLMTPDFGLMYTGIIFTILFSVFLSNFWDYLKNARFKQMRTLLLILVLAALVFTNIIPSLIYSQKAMDKSNISETYEAMKWINTNTQKEDVILSSLKEGHLVTFFAKRPSVIDENFLNQKDAETRLKDVDTIYKTSYSTEAIPLLDKYKIKYIIFSPNTAESYNIDSLKFINKNCFELVYDKEVKVYKSLCKMETT